MNQLCGLVLAGGRSSRMGFDKGTISYHGKPQRQFIFELLQRNCQRVYTSCKRYEDVPPDLNPLPDRYVLDSPLNGILTAFHLASDCGWLSVPVDMPFADVTVIQYLLNHRDESKTATCFWNEETKSPEPLLTIWEPLSKNLLIDFFERGGVSPREFLMMHDINAVMPHSADWLKSINTYLELEEFKTLHEKHRKPPQTGNKSASR